MSPDEIDRVTPAEFRTSALFGFMSALPHGPLLQYLLDHKDHATVRQVFFSEIKKRSDLPADAVDEVTQKLLAEIEDGKNRTKNETIIRYLLPHISTQMRTRAFRTLMRVGTKTMRNKLLRKLTPQDAPGVEDAILEVALSERNEHAIVGIVYRWPLTSWQQHAEDLFAAASDLPWLQRQVVFRSEKIDAFLDGKLIQDPVTELYVRARYDRATSPDLVNAAIDRAKFEERGPYDFANRIGLVAWCLGRLRLFEKLDDLAKLEEMTELER